MVDKIQITTFKDSDASFRQALNDNGLSCSRIMQLSEGVIASGITVEVLLNGGWGAFAIVCVAWLNARKTRKINVTTSDNKSVFLEGYSAEETEKILRSSNRIMIIDTKPSE